ncbi:MAG: WYL domain-containing protein [Muribaculaceae bacterium]|nr:WYL domain-containing protein [Muribaculaceae bacterium]
MARDMISRYVWIVDTLSRYGKLTRVQLNDLWLRSHLSDGRAMPERTFHYYRRSIEQNFHIDIRCNSRGEYYIDAPDSKRDRAFSNWLIDNHAVGSALQASADLDSRVCIEEVPSAREFLPDVLEAIKHNEKVVFTYAGFSRSRPEPGILFHPYFLKLYKQRWYMVGLREKSGDIRTYALDRVRELNLSKETFTMPADNPAADIFESIIGISSSKAGVKTVRLRADRTQAKYFRALPLHHSQTEELHEDYSVFTLRVKLNYELVHEILSCGKSLQVLAPPELKAMVLTELRDTLKLYDSSPRQEK